METQMRNILGPLIVVGSVLVFVAGVLWVKISIAEKDEAFYARLENLVATPPTRIKPDVLLDGGTILLRISNPVGKYTVILLRRDQRDNAFWVQEIGGMSETRTLRRGSQLTQSLGRSLELARKTGQLDSESVRSSNNLSRLLAEPLLEASSLNWY